MYSSIKKILVTQKILIVVLAALVLAGFYTTAQLVYKDKTFLPTDIDEQPEFLYGIYGNTMDTPMGVAVDAGGELFVSDPGSRQIKIFETSGEPDGAFGRPGTGKGQLNYPYGLAINKSGRLVVADPANGRISEYTRTGRFLKEIVSPDNKLGLKRPGSITVDRNLIYISDVWGHQVVVVDSEGKLVRKIGRPGSKEGELKYPQNIVVDAQHRVWVADTGNNRIQVFNGKGKSLFSIKGEENQLNLGLIRGMATDSLERVLVTDAVSSKILVFDSFGKYLFSFGALGSRDEQFKYPIGLWIADDGRIYIADRGNQRVQVWGYKGR